jgi:hypothetical protein
LVRPPTLERSASVAAYIGMTRYHFHAIDGTQYRDETGEELPSLEAAQDVALDVLMEVLPSVKAEFWKDRSFTVAVKDETGRLVATLTTTAVIDPVPEPDVPPFA